MLGTRPHTGFRYLKKFPLVFERVALQGQLQNFQRLLEALPRFRHVHPQPLELVVRRAAPQAQVEVALGEIVEHGNLPGQPQGVVPGQHDHASA